MTRDDVMRLEGRELDAAVAERVMGHEVVWVDPADGAVGSWIKLPGVCEVRDGARYPCLDALPRYSTDIAAAWEVVERLIELEIDNIELTVEVRNVAQGWACCVYSGCEEVVDVRGKSAPEAICRAALLAAAERSQRTDMATRIERGMLSDDD